jgi:hypothetical protein
MADDDIKTRAIRKIDSSYELSMFTALEYFLACLCVILVYILRMAINSMHKLTTEWHVTTHNSTIILSNGYIRKSFPPSCVKFYDQYDRPLLPSANTVCTIYFEGSGYKIFNMPGKLIKIRHTNGDYIKISVIGNEQLWSRIVNVCKPYIQ